MTININNQVGPVLYKNELALLLVEVIKETNNNVSVVDRGSYIRILADSPCRLIKKNVEKKIQREFYIPRDLETIMSSFEGHIVMSDNEIIWSAL